MPTIVTDPACSPQSSHRTALHPVTTPKGWTVRIRRVWRIRKGWACRTTRVVAPARCVRWDRCIRPRRWLRQHMGVASEGGTRRGRTLLGISPSASCAVGLLLGLPSIAGVRGRHRECGRARVDCSRSDLLIVLCTRSYRRTRVVRRRCPRCRSGRLSLTCIPLLAAAVYGVDCQSSSAEIAVHRVPSGLVV